MRIFMTGATGFIGPALIRHLKAHGHEIVGLARSRQSAEALQAMGVRSLIGSLTDLDVLRRGAGESDGVIHLAYTFSPGELGRGRLLSAVLGGWPGAIVSRMMKAITATNDAATNAMAEVLSGSGRPLISAFATMGLAGPSGERAERAATERDKPNLQSPGYVRAVSEGLMHRWAERGVRTSIVRLAPAVHGKGDMGLIPQLSQAARKHGEVIFVGDGANCWSGLHIDDAVTLFRLVLEKGQPGGIYHGVGDAGCGYREIAEIMGRRLSLPVRSGSQADSNRQFKFIAPFVSTDNPVESILTQEQLGWRPVGPTLREDLLGPDYFR
ncbi:SDR family oxidoreductase [Oryzifoliimicrobium ureilyticus]|uniref:SDR family oxidoreductase n=1 Tax=Oryzifoliimicrobium ureilyticus TaxID=3113724 RepID=UPI00307616CF